MTTLYTTRVESPIGSLYLFAREECLVALEFAELRDQVLRKLETRYGPVTLVETENPAGAASALRDFFKGDIRALDAIAVDPGGTPFQKQVWAKLRGIPAGKTTSYAAIARSVGRPKAVRAIGAANGRNPVALVIPCHRVVGSDGKLHGYAGGLDRKEWLLEHEAKSVPV